MPIPISLWTFTIPQRDLCSLCSLTWAANGPPGFCMHLYICFPTSNGMSAARGVQHTMLFDTGPEGAIFIRNCANLGIGLGEVECIAVSHGHWDHMAALPATIGAIVT